MPAAPRSVTVLLGILVTILVGWVLHVGASILQPLVIALLLATLLQPLVAVLARKHIPPALTVITLVSLLFFGLVRVGILVEASARSFVNYQPEVTENSPPEITGDTAITESQKEAIEKLGGWGDVETKIKLRLDNSDLPPKLVDFLKRFVDDIQIEQVATGLIGGGVGFIKTLTLIVLYMLFIFAEQAVFRRKILAIAGNRRADAEEVLDTIGRGIQRYLGVKTVASFATGSLCYAVLVALDIPYALLFGFLTFLLNFIPTFGSIIAGVFPTITALAVESSWNKALLVVVTYLSVNITIGSYLEPKILGRELDLSPLVIIVSVVVWAGLWGIVGAFLAVPLTSATQLVLASHESTRPFAVLLSSGPPKERRPRRRRRGRGESRGEPEVPADGGDRESGRFSA